MTIDKARIMVVEDEPLLIEVFRTWLGLLGCTQIRVACEGTDALAQLLEISVDLIISDIRMPQMDGISLVKTLRRKNIQTPFIFISGFGDIDRREMYALGVEAFLFKPIGVAEVAEQASKSLRPREEAWKTPFLQTPQQTVVMEDVLLHSSGNVPSGAVMMSIGKGGFSISTTGIMALGKIDFDLGLASEKQRLTGQGYVRWYSRAEMRAGIEIVYLAEPGRTWLLNQELSTRYNGYIPFL